MLTVLCARPVTSSTPASGHAGAITTTNVHHKATASDNNSKITKCGWSTSRARPGSTRGDRFKLGVMAGRGSSSCGRLVPGPSTACTQRRAATSPTLPKGPSRSRAPLLRATMPGYLSLVIGSFWLGRWRPPGQDDGGDGDPEEFQAEEDALVEAVGAVVMLEGAAEQQVGDGGGDRDGEQDGGGGAPGRVGYEAGGDQDGADRDGGERDEGQDQVDDAAAALGGAFDVVGEEREQAGADRPGDQQGQSAAGAAAGAQDLGQGAGDGQGQGAAQQEVRVHHPVPRAAAVVAFRVVDQAVPGPQEGQQDVDGHVDGDPGEREPGQRLRAGRGRALPRRRDGGSHRDPGRRGPRGRG